MKFILILCTAFLTTFCVSTNNDKSASTIATEMWWTSRDNDLDCKPSPNNLSLTGFTDTLDAAQKKYDVSTATEEYGYYVVIIGNPSDETAWSYTVWAKNAIDCSNGLDAFRLNMSMSLANKDLKDPKERGSKKYWESWHRHFNELFKLNLSMAEFKSKHKKLYELLKAKAP